MKRFDIFVSISAIVILLIGGYYILGEDSSRIEHIPVNQIKKQIPMYTPEPCLDKDLNEIECKG